ncbi:MAG: BACON domain-containing protein [Planctomycetota bacterium]
MAEKRSIFLWSMAALWLVLAGNANGIIYVDASATAGAQNGTSWGDAFVHLQDALALAGADPCEIWVAEGTYAPDTIALVPEGSGDRSATFQLISDVQIYGGFPTGGSLWGGRDPNAYKTTLTGDLNTDDVPGFINNDDNSYHVVTANGSSNTAILDGFIVTAGNANALSGDNSYGGGIYNVSGSAAVTNCTIEVNRASNYGGGMYNKFSDDLWVAGCTFSANSSGFSGGAMCSEQSNGLVVDCTFSENTAYDSGGGIYNYWSSPMLINCALKGNSAWYGGAALNDLSSNSAMVNCLFSGNRAYFGGAIYNFESDPCQLSCTLSGNSAESFGGGVYNAQSYPILANSILWGNSDNGGSDESAQIHIASGAPEVTFSCIQGLDTFAGDDNISGNPLFVRDPNAGGDGWGDDPCTPGVNEAVNDDFGDLRIASPVSPCVDAGKNAALPADTADLDEDFNIIEPTPLDLDGNKRIINGNGDAITKVDMGAYEFSLASIVRNPTEFTFFAAGPGFDPQSQILYVTNSGGEEMNWQITSGCNWLSADPCSGTSMGNPPDEILLQLDTSALTWGHYTCQLTISSPDAVNSPQTVQVELDMVKGDFNADGSADAADFGVFSSAWLTTPADDNWNPVCDIAEPYNIISETDLQAFTENWLQTAQ